MILHISDIHPRPGDDLDWLAESIADAARAFKIRFLVASGDLGYQGGNHLVAARWLGKLADMLKVPRGSVVVVPGNHDIEKSVPADPFGQYSKALFQLLQDSDRTIVGRATLYLCDDHEFLLVNSAYHLDTTYGKVDCRVIAQVLKSPSKAARRIAVVHHNLIPVVESDRSSIVNAYEFLKLVSDVQYDVILHGHQHFALSLRIGDRTRLIGVGSVNFKPWPNTNNQFNIVDVGARISRFRFHADSTRGVRAGNWDREDESW